MSRIIINFPDGMAEHDAINLVGKIIAIGRTSDGGKQFCHSCLTEDYFVQTHLSKSGTDSFSVSYKENK